MGPCFFLLPPLCLASMLPMPRGKRLQNCLQTYWLGCALQEAAGEVLVALVENCQAACRLTGWVPVPLGCALQEAAGEALVALMEKQGKAGEARAVCERAMATSPTTPPVWALRCLAALKLSAGELPSISAQV